MRKARIAEWILSLVTTPERAASTVGDLLETEATLRFWASVVRTGCCMLWREFTMDWGRTLGLAVFGLLATCALAPLVFVVSFGIVWALSANVASALRIVHFPMVSVEGVAYELLRISQFAGLLSLVLVSFQLGRWMARISPGRELIPCGILVVLESILSLSVWWVGLLVPRHLPAFLWGVQSHLPRLPLYLGLLMFAGAVQVRRASLRFRS